MNIKRDRVVAALLTSLLAFLLIGLWVWLLVLIYRHQPILGVLVKEGP